MKKIAYILLLALCGSVAISIGQIVPEVPSIEYGDLKTGTEVKSHFLANTQAFSCGQADHAWTNMILNTNNWRSKMIVRNSTAFLEVGIDKSSLEINEAYNYKFKFSVTLSGAQGNLVQLVDLFVAYHPDSLEKYTDLATVSFANAHKITASLVGIEKWNQSIQDYQPLNYSLAATNYFIRTKVNVSVYEKSFISNSVNYNLPFNGISSVITANKDLNISITENPSYLCFPSLYEIQWMHVEDFSMTPNVFVSPSSLTYDFSDGANSVFSLDGDINIPAIFDRGYVVYRARRLRSDTITYQKVYYSDWFGAPQSGSVQIALNNQGAIIVASHMAGVSNWQSKTAFFEDDKNKVVVDYFDGTFRKRQSITRNSTDNKLLASETVYDYSGKPVINSLPAGINSSELIMQPPLLQTQSASPVDRSDFDSLMNGCYPESLGPVNTMHGAGRYYSPNNNLQGVNRDYIPNAQGFPYTQTRYLPGSGGLVEEQSAPGHLTPLGSSRTTTLKRGNVPQFVLNKYFGLNAGEYQNFAAHYTSDPNNQQTLTVQDGSGKVILSGLLAMPEGVVNDLAFDEDPNLVGSSEVVIVDLLPNNFSNVDAQTGSISDEVLLNVAVSGQKTFNYFVKKAAVNWEYGSCAAVCVNCAYLLRLEIIDECGVPVFVAESDTFVPSKGCSTSLADKNYVVPNLNAGIYTLRRTLKPSLAGIDSAKVAIENSLVACDISLDYFVKEEVERLNDNDCAPASPCDAIEEMLITQLMPGGLYGQYKLVETNGVSEYQLENVNSNVYHDRNSWCWVYENQQTIFPMVLSNNDIIHSFSELTDNANTARILVGMTRDIAKYLLTRHPDYCKLLDCQQFEDVSTAVGQYAADLRGITGVEDFERKFGAFSLSQGIFSVLQNGDPSTTIMNASMNFSYGSSPGLSFFEKYVKAGFLAVESFPMGNPGLAFISATYPPFASAINQEYATFVSDEMNDEFVLSAIEFYLQKRNEILTGTADATNLSCVECAGGNNGMGLPRLVEQFSAEFMMAENIMDLITQTNGGQINDVAAAVAGEIANAKLALCSNVVADILVSLSQCEHLNPVFYTALESYFNTICTNQGTITYNDLIAFFNTYGVSFSTLCNPYLVDLSKWYGDASMSASNTNANLQIPDRYKNDMVQLLNTFGSLGTSSGSVSWAPVSIGLDDFFDEQIGLKLNILISSSAINFSSTTIGVEAQAVQFTNGSSQNIFQWVFYNLPTSIPVDFEMPFSVASIEPIDEIYNQSLLTMGLHRMGYYAQLKILQGGVQKELKFWNNAIPLFGLPIITKLQYQQCISCKALETQFVDFKNLFSSNTAFYADDEFMLGSFINFLKSNAIIDMNGSEMYSQLGNCNIFNHLDVAKRDADFLIELQSNLTIENFITQLKSYIQTQNEDQTYVDDLNISFLYKSSSNGKTYCKLNWGLVDSSVLNKIHAYLNLPGTGATIFPINQRQLVLRIPNGHELLSTSNALTSLINGSSATSYLDRNNLQGVMLTFNVGSPYSELDLRAIYDSLSNTQSQFHLPFDQIDVRFYIQPIPEAVKEVNDGYLYAGNVPFSYRAITDVANSLRIATSSNTEEELISKTLPATLSAALSGNFDVDYNYSPCIDCNNSLMVCEDVASNTVGLLSYFNSFTNLVVDPNTLGSALNIWHDGDTYTCSESKVLNGNLKMIFKATGNSDKLFSIWVYLPANLTVSPVNSIFINGSDFKAVGQNNGPSNLVKIPVSINGYYDVAIFQFEWPTSNCFEIPSMKFCPERSSDGLDTISCERDNYLRARQRGKEIYEQEYEKAIEDLKSTYIAQCSRQVDDSLTTSITEELAAVTLYYYDRLGNLVQTVPPRGVGYLSSAEAIKPINALSFPNHQMITKYKYNSLNLPSYQSTPDGGESRFWYDYQGRVWASRNAKQLQENAFSYTFYDGIGRIVETGEVRLGTDATAINQMNNNWLKMSSSFLSSGNSAGFRTWIVSNLLRKSVVTTQYDLPSLSSIAVPGRIQSNLINRVARIAFYDEILPLIVQGAPPFIRYATHYSYDISGNVAWLAQEFAELQLLNQQFKVIAYDYDLVSGNVKLVSYQPGANDQFYHKYAYDSDNRITSTLTSADGVIWQEDARYFYYLHGPLARVKLGAQDVQGIDYAYTIQGWLKSMNGSQNLTSADMGGDGELNNPNSLIARDVAAFSLRYFEGDYQSISTVAKNLNVTNLPSDANLFNGNIAAMSVGTYYFGALSKTFKYDFLNRLMFSDTKQLSALGSHLNSSSSRYSTDYTYDLNGNILRLERDGHLIPGLPMDRLVYSYEADNANNRLKNVYDEVPANGYTNDFTNTSTTVSYAYDAVGNLIGDLEGNSILWTPYGKVASVAKAGRTINFGYSATGERVRKELITGTHLTQRSSEYYVRDASGNVMALYSETVEAANTSANFSTINNHLYSQDPAQLHNIMQALIQNPAFMIVLSNYIRENGWLKDYLAQSNVELSSFFEWNPELIRLVFGNKYVKDYFYQNHLKLLINAMICDPVDLLTFMLSDPDWGAYIIDQICSHGQFNPLMQELLNQMGVNSCADLQNHDFRIAKARLMALVMRDFDQQQPMLYDLIMLLFSHPDFYNHFSSNSDFNALLGTTLMNCTDPTNFGSILNDYWGGDFEIFLELVGENAIIESLLLGNFEDFYNFLVSLQIPTDLLNELLSRLEGFTVTDYLALIRQVLGESVYQSLLQLSPNILNFEKVLTLQEQYLYGSKRLGVRRPKLLLATAPHTGSGYQPPLEVPSPGGWYDIDCNCYNYEEPVVPGAPPASPSFATRFYIHELGRKEYELTNHLGNVLATVLDRKTGVKASPTATTYAWFKADVASAQDYYPFGMLMPGRTYTAGTAQNYRYGMNGQEKDDEIYGAGNSYSAEYWQYDARIGRRWNIDPVVKPWESPYAAFGNNPVWFIDPNGDDFVNVHTKRKEDAGVKRDEAASGLESAKDNMKRFEGMSKKDAKNAGQLKEFKAARSNLKSAQKAFDIAENTYQQEVFYEGVVNQVLNDFRNTNPEKYAEWDKFNPNGNGVIDIEVSAQSQRIQMLDNQGFPTGRTTTEAINARITSSSNSFVRVRLHVVKVNDVIKIQAMTSVLVHGLGHVDGGQRRDEEYAVKYQIKNYDSFLKKKK